MKGKIYISGGISGRPEEEYKEHFKKAEDALLTDGYAVYNPVSSRIIQEIYQNYGYAACLAKCIAMLRFCTHIFLLEGWENSPGAKAELAFAEACGIKVIYEHEYVQPAT